MANAVSGLITIPLLTSSVELISYGATVSASLAPLEGTAEGGGQSNVILPKLTLTSSAKPPYVASVSLKMPVVCLTSSGLCQGRATVYALLPSLLVSIAAHVNEKASLHKHFPLIKLVSSAINNPLARMTAEIDALRISSSAYWLKGGKVAQIIPSIISFSRASNGAVATIIMNTKNFALTEYSSYDYNSLGLFNGKMVGAKATGIYELSGDDDDGENIEWSFKTGKLDIDDARVKRVRHVWLSYNPSGDLLLIVDDGEDEHEYEVDSFQQIDNAVRVKLGKGIRNRYLQLELKNVANETIKLDRIRLFADQLGNKR